MALIKIAQVRFATDHSMATITNTSGSSFRTALENLLSQVAAGIIASDPTIIQAAENALQDAINSMGLVQFTHPAIPKAGRLEHDPSIYVREYDVTRAVTRAILADGTQYMPRAWIDDLFVPDRVLAAWETARGWGEGTGGSDDSFTATHIIVAAGQSNMVGGNGTPVPVGTNDALPNLFTIPQQGANAGDLVQAVDPLAHPVSEVVPGSRGPAVRFARKYARQNPRVRVVIVPVAQSGTGFRGDPISWAPAREGEAGVTSLYRDAINRVNAAVTQTNADRVAAILWHQGERDARAGTTGTQYASDLDALILGFRSEMSGAANTPFIVGQLAWEFRNVYTEAPTATAIDTAHQGTPGRVARTAFAPAPPQGHADADDIHLLGSGQWRLAASMWNAYDTALYNL